MALAVNMGWFLLDKYYSRTDVVPVYAAALLLDPEKRLGYINTNWEQSWVKDAVAATVAIWETDYKPLSTPPIPVIEPEVQLTTLEKLLQESTVSQIAYLQLIISSPLSLHRG